MFVNHYTGYIRFIFIQWNHRHSSSYASQILISICETILVKIKRESLKSDENCLNRGQICKFDYVLWKRCRSSFSGRISILNRHSKLCGNYKQNGMQIVKFINGIPMFSVLNVVYSKLYTKINVFPLFFGGFQQFATILTRIASKF
jgi:hypothetical protein